MIKLQIMMWPIVGAKFESESDKQLGEDRFLTTDSARTAPFGLGSPTSDEAGDRC